MYKLTLTREERNAFDFVGARYATGCGIATYLMQCRTENDQEWDSEGDVTFLVEEHIAWRIYELGEEEQWQWPLFGPPLAQKMQQFCDSMV